MFFAFLILLNIFPPDWEALYKALTIEGEDRVQAMEIYKKYSSRNDTLGIFSLYKMACLDEKDSYGWFLKLKSKNPPKEMLEDAYKKLIEDENEKAINDYERIKKGFSLRFRKKIEEKIFLKRFEKNKDKRAVLYQAIKEGKRVALILSKRAISEGEKLPEGVLKELLSLSLKYRDLELFQGLISNHLREKELGQKEIFLLGRFYFLKKEYEKSINYFERLKDEKALFQKARAYLYIGKEKEAILTLENIKKELLSEAQYLLLRIKLKNGKLEEAEKHLNLIKKMGLKSKATLNMAIHLNFYGKKDEAKALLGRMKENNEIKFWKNRLEGIENLSFMPQDSPFNYFFNGKYPQFQVSETPLNLNFKPVNFPQFLVFKGFVKEGLFFRNTLKFDPVFLSKLYLSQKKYKNAINSIYSEAENVLKKDIGQWNIEVLRIYFPRAYGEEVKKLCKEYKIPSNLFWAVMRQESLFEEEAISSEGALGLMQVLPQNYLLYGEDLENPFEKEKNMRVSLKYLKELKERFGEWVYVISAYNAGEEAVSFWLKDPIMADLPSFYSTIPFEETKVYTRNVLFNLMMYNILYGEEDEKS
ncbi:MAG: transglycosylase SLT domain-containing protein [Thermoanaerobaculia bacterium]